MLSKGIIKLRFKLREIYQAFLMIKAKTCKSTFNKLFHYNVKNCLNFTKTYLFRRLIKSSEKPSLGVCMNICVYFLAKGNSTIFTGKKCVLLNSVQEFIEREAWLLLTFFLCLHN